MLVRPAAIGISLQIPATDPLQGGCCGSTISGYGGSGSSYQLFWVRYLDKTVHLVPLFKGTGELSYPYFLNQGNQIILFEAIWDMDQGESHYSAHRIQLTSISLENQQPIQQILGTTTSKYLLPDSEIAAKALLDQFKLHESKFSELKHF